MNQNGTISRARSRAAPRAFTIVEVLVAIAVIAIVGTLTIGAAGALRARAKAMHCLANLREVGLVTATIVSEQRELYPFWVANMPASPPILRQDMQEVYGGHVGGLESFVCPADPRKGRGNYTSYRYYPGEEIADEIEHSEPGVAIATISRVFRDADLASILFDRGRWHPERVRHAVYAQDWHVGVLE